MPLTNKNVQTIVISQTLFLMPYSLNTFSQARTIHSRLLYIALGLSVHKKACSFVHTINTTNRLGRSWLAKVWAVFQNCRPGASCIKNLRTAQNRYFATAQLKRLRRLHKTHRLHWQNLRLRWGILYMPHPTLIMQHLVQFIVLIAYLIFLSWNSCRRCDYV